MSHVFSAPGQDPGNQRISPEEARELIRTHQNREASLDSSVTVQAMAETLGLPTWQVEQMVQQMRNRPPVTNSPMPGGAWLRTQLWKWALAAVLAAGIGPGLASGIKNLTWSGWNKPGQNRTVTDGIYDHSVVELGREFGMKAPPGFSYKIRYGTVEAAANGDSKHYVPVDDLSKENIGIIQEQYAEAIMDGFSKAIAKSPPDWVNGEAAATVRPNYYDSGYADPFDITLQKEGFPYDPNKPASKEMHDSLLKSIQGHWDDITD